LKAKTLSILILMVLSGVYVSSCRRMGTWLVRDDSPEHADAMVILMGSLADRLLQAADLYRSGIADRLIIVVESRGAYKALSARGVSPISSTDQARDAAIALGIPADRITILPGDARSTLAEAMIIRDYLSGNGSIDTLLLVTSAPHTRRASIIFRKTLRDTDPPVCIMTSPSAYTDFNPEKWWMDKEGIQSVLSEMAKISSFLVFESKQISELN